MGPMILRNFIMGYSSMLILMVATPLMLLAIAIGEERRSKKALQVSEERMGMTAQSAQLALWDWDVANDRVWVRDQGLFGFDPNAPVDHSTLAGSVHPDDRADGRSTAPRWRSASARRPRLRRRTFPRAC